MKYFKKVEGERVYLSPLNSEDVIQYTKWINDPAISDNMESSSYLISIANEKEWLENAETAKDYYVFAIVKTDGDELLGNCSFYDIYHIHRRAKIWLVIGEESNRGKGYGTEALRLLLRYGFNTLNLNNIMLQVFAFNEQAIACYKKVGFKTIGERRNAYYVNGKYHNEIFMDILREEFEI